MQSSLSPTPFTHTPTHANTRSSVRAFADRVASSFPGGIHCLVNNAGVLNPPTGRHPLTDDGIEVGTAVLLSQERVLLCLSFCAAHPLRGTF